VNFEPQWSRKQSSEIQSTK